jgi:hypothetical protein
VTARNYAQQRQAKLWDQYLAMSAAGMTGLHMAAVLGLTRKQVYWDLAALGLAQGCRGCPPEQGRQRIAAAKAAWAGIAAERHEQAASRTGKVCPRCPERGEQPLSAFHANRSTVDGRAGFCRACYRVWRAERERVARKRAVLAARDRRRRERLAAERREQAARAERELAELAERVRAAEAAGVRPYRLRVMRQEPHQERSCCYGDGNGTHAPGCLLGRVARTA